ncbi:hypothetical protein [Thiocapsa marina]|uniref:Lipoprotein n=1 Tax=Thiocapsa marina 5811 TaxID=768671 RepID=F9UHQ6_9GAMM|nr:hypothetical protein [Thiocapsa marina]EGV16232.1 hypothetical protein ThimaDRAFT_4459 [Thiocapsa marina 5811]
MSQPNNVRLTACLLLSGLLAAGCASSAVERAEVQRYSGGIEKLVLMDPWLDIIDSNTGNALPANDPKDAELRTLLLSSLGSELATRPRARSGTSEFTANAHPSFDVARMYRDIRVQSGEARDEQLLKLREWNASRGASHLLFCRYRVYVGPGGLWDPTSGVIKSNSSRTLLECHLYDLEADKVTWSHAVQSRTAKNGAKSALAELVPRLFAAF